MHLRGAGGAWDCQIGAHFSILRHGIRMGTEAGGATPGRWLSEQGPLIAAAFGANRGKLV